VSVELSLHPPPSSEAAAVERLGIQREHAVLDLGCGDGRHSVFIRESHPRLHVAFDIGLSALRGVRELDGPAVRGRAYVCGDGIQAPFADASFDRVVCSLVLYLVPFERGVRELARLMRRDALAYVRVPMLSWGRLVDTTRTRSLRRGVYGANQVLSGAVFALVGRQVRNPILRHDSWACYLPLRRFRQVVEREGFAVEDLRIDRPRPRVTSIDAWLRRT